MKRAGTEIGGRFAPAMWKALRAMSPWALLLAAVAGAQPLPFPAPLREPLGGIPSAMAAGDLDEDGVADIVVADFPNASLSVFLGGGVPLFTFSGDYPSGGAGHRLLIARVDADEHPDILVSEQESDNVWLLRGNGDGSLRSPERIDPGHDPVGVALADLDGDGELDLAVALSDEVGGRLAVLRGDGDGHFERIQGIDLPAGSEEVVLHDFDRDGPIDAAVSNAIAGSVSVLRGRGDGTFERSGEIPVGRGASPLALADVDMDGDLDLLVGNTGDDTVAVLRSRSDGSFAAPQLHAVGGRGLKSMTVADVNRDGRPDIVTANLRSQSVSLLLAEGDAFAAARCFVTDAGPVAIAAVDADGDSLLDLLTANESIGAELPVLAVLPANPAGGFRAVEQLPGLDESGPLAVADFDEDALPDVVVGLPNARAVAIVFGAEEAGPIRRRTFEAGGVARDVAAEDFDGDGHADAAVLNTTADVSLLFGDSTGTLSPPLLSSAGVEASAMAAGDFDGDGRVDLLLAGARDSRLTIVHNDGDRSFTLLSSIVLDGLASAIVAADFDADGDLDIAVGSASGGAVVVLVNDGHGTFASNAPLAARGVPFAIAAGDIDHSGTLDLAFAVAAMGQVRTLLNQGEAVFASGPSQSVGSFPRAVALRDLDNDRRPDLIVSDQLRDTTSVLHNSGTRIEWQGELPTSVRASRLATGDFNGDGLYDAISGGVTLTRMINESSAARTVRRGDANGDGRVSAADLIALELELLDGDGDLVEASTATGYVADLGADNDGDGRVRASDLRALVRRLMRP